jgi:hypothetical protein
MFESACLNGIQVRALTAVTFTVMVPSAPPLQLTAVCVVKLMLGLAVIVV